MSAADPLPRPQGGLTCAAAAELVREFLANRERVSERSRLRNHLSECATCREDYRSRVEQTASLQRSLRHRRVGHSSTSIALVGRASPEADPGGGAGTPSAACAGAPEGDDEHETQSEMDGETDAEGPAPPARRNLIAPTARGRFRLPKPLVVAAGVLLLLALGGTRGSPDTRLVALGGDVRAAQRDLVAGEIAEELRAGDALSTGADGRARLERGGAAIELAPRTAILIERSAALAVRLLAGTVCLVGVARIVTPYGVVETDGGVAHVRQHGASVVVECESGSVTITDHAGSRALSTGETQPLQTPG